MYEKHCYKVAEMKQGTVYAKTATGEKKFLRLIAQYGNPCNLTRDPAPDKIKPLRMIELKVIPAIAEL